jgi:hypothetical protein
MVFETTYFPQSIFYGNMHDNALHAHDSFRVRSGVSTHFGLPEVRTYMLSIARGHYRLSSSSFGSGLYRETQVVGSFQYDISERFRSGVSIAFLNYWIQDLYSRCGYAVHMSMYYDKGDLLVGGWLNNINIPRFNEGDAIPLAYTIRVEYSLHDRLVFILASRGTHETMPFFNAGVSWALCRHLTMGAGANTEPLYFEYMIQIPVGRIGIHYTGNVHEYLGVSHAMHLTFDL